MKCLVIVEHDSQKNKPVTLNTITAASNIDKNIEAIVIGCKIDKVVDEIKKSNLLKYVHVFDHENFERQLAENLSNCVVNFLNDNDFTHILAPSSTFGKNLLPKIATKLDVQQISDVSNVIDENTFERPIYAGNAIAKVKSNDKIKVLTVRTTCFEPCETSSSCEVIKHENKTVPSDKVAFVKHDSSKSDRPELTSAKIIISGGRGLQNGENFKLLEVIADKLGAAMGASRAAVDAGFVPNDWQVGQTGKIVAPDLYIAVGISGAIQHIAGIKDSKFIACINKDEEAPIFNFSDYGLVADLFEALPQLEKKL